MITKHIFQTLSMCLLLVFVFACKKGKREWDMTPTDKDPVLDLNEGDSTFSYIFRQRYEGYACYRIPALVRAKDGTLIAFAEARRYSCSDIGDIDLVMKRSKDDGKTWGPLEKIWDDGDNTCGNPAPVLDEITGEIHLLLTWNFGTDDISDINKGTSKDTRRVFISSSKDNGATWSAPKEITNTTKRPEWGWYATGPCHGIQLKQGPHAGRLIIPCDFIEKGSGGRAFSHVIYSDDHGATWQIGGISPKDKANESTVAELSDGTLMLNMRHTGKMRYVATSDDHGITWKNMNTDPRLPDPVCQGSLLSAKVDDKHTLFFSNLASSERREKITIRMSEDDGANWAKKYEVYSGPAAYSDLIMMNSPEIGILYESGASSPYTGISFKTIPLTEFK
jgi:BNR/Asp-box repeat.